MAAKQDGFENAGRNRPVLLKILRNRAHICEVGNKGGLKGMMLPRLTVRLLFGYQKMEFS